MFAQQIFQPILGIKLSVSSYKIKLEFYSFKTFKSFSQFSAQKSFLQNYKSVENFLIAPICHFMLKQRADKKKLSKPDERKPPYSSFNF